MIKIFLLIFISISGFFPLSSQTITEKKLFTLTFKGIPDIYSFIQDESGKNYCYSYYIEDEGKYFIISEKSLSEKYNYINIRDIAFDKKGNYFAVCGNYAENYGLNNNFLIINGKEVFNSNYIESYSSFINKEDEYTFIFTEKEKYYFGYIKADGKIRKSESYDMLKPAYKDSVNLLSEGDEEGNSGMNMFMNENGDRGFIAIRNGKASIIIGSEIFETDYSDINEASITRNRNGDLSFIAKKGGRIYESVGNEMVVSGKKEYNIFQTVHPPLIFNKSNEPVYYASDSISENKYDYFVVKGNDRQPANYFNKKINFAYGINRLKLNEYDEPVYFGIEEYIIPAVNTGQNPPMYDEYYSLYYYVRNTEAFELGYNVSNHKFSKEGKLLYPGIADIQKKEYLLLESSGESRVILNDEKFDQIIDFGYTPDGEIYYVGEIYEDSALNKKHESLLFIGKKIIGRFNYILFQGYKDNYSVLKFDSKNNFAFTATEGYDTVVSASVYTNNGKLPVPGNASDPNVSFNSILGLMFTKNDKLFFIGEYTVEKNKFKYELFSDNVSLGKVYDFVDKIDYNVNENKLTFYATKDKSIFKVEIQF